VILRRSRQRHFVVQHPFSPGDTTLMPAPMERQ